MLNIKFTKTDHTEDLADVLKEPPIENANRVKQINTFKYTGIAGLLSVALVIFGMIMIAKGRMDTLGISIKRDTVLIVEVIAGFAILQFLVLPFVHEFLHALVYPRNIPTTIYYKNSHTYSEAKMGKHRYILMLLMPHLLLCILPFVLLMLLMPVLPAREAAVALMLILYSDFTCLLDWGSAWVIAIFVPEKAKAYVHGKYLYWER
jgi:hypothetical protein